MHPLIKSFCLLTLPPHFLSTSLSAKFPTWHSSFNLCKWILQNSVLYFQNSLFMNLGLDLQRHIWDAFPHLFWTSLYFSGGAHYLSDLTLLRLNNMQSPTKWWQRQSCISSEARKMAEKQLNDAKAIAQVIWNINNCRLSVMIVLYCPYEIKHQ